jgi:hypothetical protein
MFVKDSEMVILFEKGHHDDRGKKNQRFSRKIPA